MGQKSEGKGKDTKDRVRSAGLLLLFFLHMFPNELQIVHRHKDVLMSMELSPGSCLLPVLGELLPDYVGMSAHADGWRCPFCISITGRGWRNNKAQQRRITKKQGVSKQVSIRYR